MDRIRRSFRDSFRRRGSRGGGSLTGGGGSNGEKPQLWQQDEAAVRAGTCNFAVKYLGCVEVFESRGMQVCEEALKVLRNQRRNPIKGILYVSGDGLRVADADSKGLVLDQTIEKVSFCAPDRSHERGFAYICRDGTTRRWMCHGFHAAKETGERLSHAVGCAFAVCLEKKQKRDREAANSVLHSQVSLDDALLTRSSSTPDSVSASVGVSPAGSNFRRSDFRRATLTERMQDPQNVKPTEKPPVKTASNPHAVARPHANPELLFKREGSLRLSAQEGAEVVSPFKRNYSLRLNELPSTLARHNGLGSAAGYNGTAHGGRSCTGTQSAHSTPLHQAQLTAAARINVQRGSVSAAPEISPLPEEDYQQLTPQFDGLMNDFGGLSTRESNFTFDTMSAPSLSTYTANRPNLSSVNNYSLQPALDLSSLTTNNTSQQQQQQPPNSAVNDYSGTNPAAQWSGGRSRAAEWLESAASQARHLSDPRVPTPPNSAPHPPAPPPQSSLSSACFVNSGASASPQNVATSSMDIFGQPVFSTSSAVSAPPNGVFPQSQSFGPDKSPDFDPFEAKWDMLEPKSQRSTNPFEAESSSVNI